MKKQKIGVTMMINRIEKLDGELRLVGCSEHLDVKETKQVIPRLWRRAQQEGLLERLIDMSWENPKCQLEGLLGVCDVDGEKMKYLMGIRFDATLPEKMEEMVISHDLWVVFPNVAKAWAKLHTEWLPKAEFSIAEGIPYIECYFAPGVYPNDELWVPVIRK